MIGYSGRNPRCLDSEISGGVDNRLVRFGSGLEKEERSAEKFPFVAITSEPNGA